MIRYYYSSTGEYRQEDVIDYQESIIFDGHNNKLRLFGNNEFYFQKLSTVYKTKETDASLAASQNSVNDMYVELNTSIYDISTKFTNLNYLVKKGTGEESLLLNDISTNYAEGKYSIAEGYDVSAIGNYSHAEGDTTIAKGTSSHTEGSNTIAYNISEHASGQYNLSNSDVSTTFGLYGNTLFSVGYGTSDTDRKNAFEIRQDASIYIAGISEPLKNYILNTSTRLSAETTERITSYNNLQTNINTNNTSIFDISTRLNDVSVRGSNTSTRLNDVSIKVANASTKINTNFNYINDISAYTINTSTRLTTNLLTVNSSISDISTRLKSANTSIIDVSNKFTALNYIIAKSQTGEENLIINDISTNSASGKYSIAEGYNTNAQNQSEHAFGQYNISNKIDTNFGNSGNTLFSIGYGTSSTDKKNALELRQDGSIYIAGLTTSLYNYITSLETRIKTLETKAGI